MKVKNNVLVNSMSAINSLLNKTIDVETEWNLVSNAEEIEKSIKPYYTVRQKLIEKYADKDSEGKAKITEGKYTFFDSKDNSKKFNEEIEKLNDLEADVNIEKINLSSLKGSGIVGRELMLIKFMIEK